MPEEVVSQTINPPTTNPLVQSQHQIEINNNDNTSASVNTSASTNDNQNSSTNGGGNSANFTNNNTTSIKTNSNTNDNSGSSDTTIKSSKGRVTKLDDSNKPPKKKGKPGRPRIHHDNQGTVAGSRMPQSGYSVSVNEVIPKVWVISNFSVPFMAQIAVEALKKGDKVVLGCCPGGEGEPKLLKQADRLRQRYPERCIVVELDIK